jgi:pilus assembly protein CpaC
MVLVSVLLAGKPAMSSEPEPPATQGASSDLASSQESDVDTAYDGRHLDEIRQAMADLHSPDAAIADEARQLLEQAELTPEQRRFAELVRHPEAERRLDLIRQVQKSEDVESRHAILDFLRSADSDPEVRDAATKALSPVPQTLEAAASDGIELTRLELAAATTNDEPARSAVERKYLVDQTSADPEQSIELQEKRATYLRFKQAPVRDEVTDEEVLDVQLVGPNEYRVYAKASGSSVVSFWFENPEAPGDVDVLSYVVRVLSDPEEDERMRVLLRNLERDLNRTFPNSSVQLSYVGQQVVIRGQAKDVEEATHISRIVSQSLPDNDTAEEPFDPQQIFLGDAGAQDLVDAGGLRGLLTGQNAAGVNAARINSRVINLLQISGIHQVMLKVTVAEVNRSAARSMGLDFSATDGSFSISSNLPSVATGLLTEVVTTDFTMAIRAMKSLNLSRTLAEPTLTTLNGQQAQMNVGGSFPVPQVTGATATGLQGVTFQQFGVQMGFLPTVTDNDRIRLIVQATVSTRDESTGTMVGNSNVAGLSSRNFNTTVELRQGTTLAVGGLVQTNLGSASQRIPLVGDVPFLGRAFSSDNTSYDEQELIVLVTPYLVGPVDDGPEALPLPGSDYFEPDDFEFFLQGRLEGRRAEDFRSPARTDLERIKSFRKLEQQYFIGQPGHSNAVFVPR